MLVCHNNPLTYTQLWSKDESAIHFNDNFVCWYHIVLSHQFSLTVCGVFTLICYRFIISWLNKTGSIAHAGRIWNWRLWHILWQKLSGFFYYQHIHILWIDFLPRFQKVPWKGRRSIEAVFRWRCSVTWTSFISRDAVMHEASGHILLIKGVFLGEGVLTLFLQSSVYQSVFLQN